MNNQSSFTSTILGAAALATLFTTGALAGQPINLAKQMNTPLAEWPEFDFINAKVTLQAPGHVAFRQHWEGVTPGHGEKFFHILESELTIGILPHLQLSLIEASQIISGSWDATAVSTRLRYALADYGRIPLNPMLQAGWEFAAHGPGAWQGGLLLSERIGDRWLWAGNFVWDQVTGGDRDREILASTGLRYEVLPGVSVGGEFKFENAKVPGQPSQSEYLLGPSFVWRINDHCGIVAGSFFGLSKDSIANETNVTLQIRF